MPIQSYNDLVARAFSGYAFQHPVYGDVSATTGLLGGNTTALARAGYVRNMPSLPSGVTAYLTTNVTLAQSGTNAIFLVARLIDLGSLNIATPTFTDGSAMPTVTEMNTSRQISGPVWIEVTTALNSTPGSITVTYIDQDGNSAETTSAQALPTSNGNVRTGGFVVLNGTDTGVRDITSATRTGGSSPSGVIRFWGVIPVSIMPTSVSGANGTTDNLLTSGFNPIRLGASDTLGIFMLSSTSSLTARGVMGNVCFVGDT